MKAVVFNLGCKVNQYECDMLIQGLRERGYETFSDLQEADLYIVNTCAVTNEAERKSRQAIKRCLNFNKNARIIICGCASQHNADNFKKDNVAYITGVRNKQEILKHLDDISGEENICQESSGYDDFDNPLAEAGRTRAFVKIQDGCNCFCTYCIIPYLRGKSRSRDAEKIINEIEILQKSTKEIVLTGINLMLYGLDKGTNLTELINSLRDYDVRIRLGSFYVEGLSKELLDGLFRLKHFCPHFHLSLQSGDDNVLKNMNRHYTTEQYKEKIALIRSYDGNAAITTDIIVGFPTESGEEFDNTMKFVEEAGFSDIHIFPFSSRKGTVAEKWKVLPAEIIKDRESRLFELKKRLQKAYLNANIGIIQEVLFEADTENNIHSGYSERYIRVYAENPSESVLERVTPVELYKDGLKGEIKNG